MREPWSIVAEHPSNNEPFGIVIEDESTFAEAEHIARSMLSTCRLLGTYIPAGQHSRYHGNYLFVYRADPDGPIRLGHIWATCHNDAQLRLAILAEEGILFMPSSG